MNRINWLVYDADCEMYVAARLDDLQGLISRINARLWKEQYYYEVHFGVPVDTCEVWRIINEERKKVGLRPLLRYRIEEMFYDNPLRCYADFDCHLCVDSNDQPCLVVRFIFR